MAGELAGLAVDADRIEPELVGRHAAAGRGGEPAVAGWRLHGELQLVDDGDRGAAQLEIPNGQLLHPRVGHRVGGQRRGHRHVAHEQASDRDAAAAGRVGGLAHDVEQVPSVAAPPGGDGAAENLQLVEPGVGRPELRQPVAHRQPVDMGQLAPVLMEAQVLEGQTAEGNCPTPGPPRAGSPG